jgi:eukaryotic-like serine/threonine-protein kinase
MSRWLFRVGQTIEDPYSSLSYRIEQWLGSGSSGQVFRAEQLTQTGLRRPRGIGTVCLKVTTKPEAWHGECYFGLLTRGLPNIVQHLGGFPVLARGETCYVLIMELQTGGTVQDWIDQRPAPEPWTPELVINALCPLARALEALHVLGAVHRDITPANVFIGDQKSLRLGDFGIAPRALAGHGQGVDVSRETSSVANLLETRHEWLARDDVYQLGLVGLSLLSASRVHDPDWSSLRYQVDHAGLRRVLQCATGPRERRYDSAGAFRRELMVLGGQASQQPAATRDFYAEVRAGHGEAR